MNHSPLSHKKIEEFRERFKPRKPSKNGVNILIHNLQEQWLERAFKEIEESTKKKTFNETIRKVSYEVNLHPVTLKKWLKNRAESKE